MKQNQLKIFVITLLILGIFFRLVNLDKKVYWHDEVYTSLHIAGYTWDEWMPAIFNGKIIGIEVLQNYLHLSPEKDLGDLLHASAVDDPHRPPLYYIIARFWLQLFGNSITAIRSLSALFSLLALPAIYWLSLELFAVPLIAWVAVILLTVSPFHVLFAQEAREYALWTVLILLSSLALLKAIKLTNEPDSSWREYFWGWGFYALTLSLGLYTSLLTSLIAIAHGIYIFTLAVFASRKILIAYVSASLIALLSFSPWIWVFLENYQAFQRATKWTKYFRVSSLDLLRIFVLNISRVFADTGKDSESLVTYIIMLASLILVGYAIYFLILKSFWKTWLFILTLTTVPLLFLLIPDLIFGGVRSLSPRYLIPCFLGIQLSVAYLLGTQLINQSLSQTKIWSFIFTLVVSSGLISCAISTQSNTSWSKVISYSLPKVAEIINQTERPLLVGNNTSYNPGNILALSYILKPTVKLQLLSEQNYYSIPQGFSDVFFLSPSDELRNRLERQQKVKIELVLADNHLWLWKTKFTSKDSPIVSQGDFAKHHYWRSSV